MSVNEIWHKPRAEPLGLAQAQWRAWNRRAQPWRAHPWRGGCSARARESSRQMLGPGTGRQPAGARPGHGKAAGTREVKGHSAWRRRDQPERQAAGSGQQHRYEGAGAHARVSGGIGDAHCCSSMPRRSPEGPSCSQRRRVGTHSNCLACRCTRLMSRTRTRRVRVGKMQVEWAAMWVRAWAKLSSWRGTGTGGG